MAEFVNTYAKLPQRFFAHQAPTHVQAPELIAFNAALASQIGLPYEHLDEQDLAQIFGGNVVPDWANPIATAYAGHQFGHLVPQLGDGRAVLLAELKAGDKSAEIQLKGSGRTPYSRGGDGRSWLGPVLREYVVSEAMHQFGVPTTRALAAIATGEHVQRETTLPGGVFTRLATSHVRVGTFLNFAIREDQEAIELLVDHCIAQIYPQLADHENKALALLEKVVERQAILIAKWMSIGFVHGVMNTDNMAISGETIDYGPCAFIDKFQSDKVFSSIDKKGRYAYSKQPAIAHWNLVQLAGMLLQAIHKDEAKAIELAQGVVDAFPAMCKEQWRIQFGRKLGLASVTQHDDELIEDLLLLLEGEERDFTLSFRFLSTHNLPQTDALMLWQVRWSDRLRQDGVQMGETLTQRLWQENPILIPRNHQIERVIQAAVQENDYSRFHMVNEALRTPFSEMWHGHELAEPPLAEEEVLHTFCGT